jgi:hypothetical protein
MKENFMITPITGTSNLNSTQAAAPAAHAPAETKAPQAAKQDPVQISKLAQKLASDGDTQAQEVSENGAERASESARGRA